MSDNSSGMESGEGGPGARGNAGQTFVLVHGAWHGGWCWSRVATLLRQAGHRVFTPTQTGLGERCHLLSADITLATFTTDIVNLLEFEELRDVILVGHSFGGSSVSGVAAAVPERLRHLVYIDAMVLEAGQAPFDILPPEIVEARRQAAFESSGGLSLPVPPPNAFGVFEEKDAAWLARRLTPHPLSAYESPLQIDGAPGNDLPRTYVACIDPCYPALATIREKIRAERDWNWLEVPTGHDAMVTAPRELTALLQKVAN